MVDSPASQNTNLFGYNFILDQSLPVRVTSLSNHFGFANLATGFNYYP